MVTDMPSCCQAGRIDRLLKYNRLWLFALSLQDNSHHRQIACFLEEKIIVQGK